MAGQSSGEMSFEDPVADLRKNTISTLNLIRFGIENKVEKIVYASSISVYGSVEEGPTAETTICRPLSCYRVCKLTPERYLEIF